MPYIDAAIFMKKGVKCHLTLSLDEDDSIIDCIKRAMVEHKIYDVTIESVEGKFKEATINYFERNQFKSQVLRGNSVMIASGNYKLSYGELFGTFKVATNDKPPIQGTLVKGRAHQGFTIVLSFTEYVDKPEDPKTVK